MLRLACALALLTLAASPALAETRRVALVVGNNAGGPGRKPLRYAESDADKFARVLTELGGVEHDDLLLLEGADATAVERGLGLLAARIAELHRKPDVRVVLVFYFSGHSDGAALELGKEKLAYGDLKKLLAVTGAEVKLAIVDACQSGGLLATKGGSAGPSFSVNLADDLDARGSVFLTSSAGSEYALESSEVQGSYFTHHLVSGLRGAADSSGDGRVTLAEAYQYAFDRTVAATAQTTVGPQHPRYDYALSGQGELVLTELRDRPVAALILPDGLQRALVVDLAHDQVVAEVGPNAATRVTVGPGDYGVRLWRDGKPVGERLALHAGEERRLQWDELRPESGPLVASKGGALPEAEVQDRPAVDSHESAASLGLLASAGLSRGFSDVPASLGLRLGFENLHPSGLGLSVEALRGTRATTSETDLSLRLSLRVGTDLSRARLFLALEAGPGIAWVREQGATSPGPTLSAGPRAGLRFSVSPRLYLTFEGGALGSLAFYASKVHAALLPTALAGVELGVF